MVIESLKNFLVAFEKKVESKMGVFSRNSNPILRHDFFSKFIFLYFSLRIFCLNHRMILIFLLAWRAMLGSTFKYLEHCYGVYKKFSGGIWKKNWVKNGCLGKKSHLTPNSILRHVFFSKFNFCTFPWIYFVWDIVWP